MNDVVIVCDNVDECPCEAVCCQHCARAVNCPDRCRTVRYKQKVYQSDAFLIEELTDVAQGTGIWLIWVAVERLRSLTGYTGYADSIGGVH